MKNWFNMKAEDGKAVISIYDEIGGWGVTAKGFRDSLKEMGDVDHIEMRINSPGGSVIDGFAIYNMLLEHPAKVTAKIDGWAASMASIIAMAADEIQMPANTWMMIHNPWTAAVGEADDLRRMAEILEKMENHALLAYERHSNLPESEIRELMNNETWMDGTDAVAKGFADVLTDELEIAATVKPNTLDNAPQGALAWVKENKMEEEVKAPEEKEEVTNGTENEGEQEVNETPAVESDTADVEECGDSEEVEEITEVEAVEGEDVSSKFDAAYDEGEAVGYARGKKEGETNAIAEIAELQNKLAEVTEDVEALSESVTAKDETISNLTARLEKLTGGLKASEESNKTPMDFAQAVKEYGYEKARKKFPELYAANRKYNRENRREK